MGAAVSSVMVSRAMLTGVFGRFVFHRAVPMV